MFHLSIVNILIIMLDYAKHYFGETTELSFNKDAQVTLLANETNFCVIDYHYYDCLMLT